MTPERIKWLLRKAEVNQLNEREKAIIRNIKRLFQKGSEISEKQTSTLENIANKPFLVKRYIKKTLL